MMSTRSYYVACRKRYRPVGPVQRLKRLSHDTPFVLASYPDDVVKVHYGAGISGVMGHWAAGEMPWANPLVQPLRCVSRRSR